MSPRGLLLVLATTGAISAQASRPSSQDSSPQLREEVRLVRDGIESSNQRELGQPSPLARRLMTPDSGWALLKDWDLELKAIQGDDAEVALGAAYHFTKALDLGYQRPTEWTTRGLVASFEASGTVSFDPDINSADFLSTKGYLHFFQNSGGISNTVAPSEDGRPLDAEAMALQQRIADAEAAEVAAATPEEARAAQERTRALLGSLDTQVYLDLSVNAGLESNQRFTEKQWTYGLLLALDVKPWNPDAALARFNLFDYPFAVLRLLSGADRRFQLRGSAFPTVLVGIDHVMPQGDDPRAQVGDDSDFARARAEIGMRTPLAKVKDSWLHASVDYRHYHEIGASSAVRGADLDAFDYLSIAITSDTGVFASYRTGRLPFDSSDQSMFEVGFKFHLGGGGK